MAPMFVPGPVDVAPEVLAAQAKPMMPHRSKDFEAIFKQMKANKMNDWYVEVERYSVEPAESVKQSFEYLNEATYV